MQQPIEKQLNDLSQSLKDADKKGLEQGEREKLPHDFSLDTEYLPESPLKPIFTSANHEDTAKTAQQVRNSSDMSQLPEEEDRAALEHEKNETLPERIQRPVFTPPNSQNIAKTAQQAHNSLVVLGKRGHQFRIALAERHKGRLKKLGYEPPFLRELNEGDQAKIIAAVGEAFEQPSGKKLICRENFAYSSVAMPHGIPTIIELMDLNLPHIEQIIDYCPLLNETYDRSLDVSLDFPDGATRMYFFSEEYLYQGQFVTMDDFLARHPEQALRLFDQVCSGVKSLHVNGIYHRDLKGTNVVISGDTPETAQAIIIDFATSTKEKTSRDYCGTIGYMRPEALLLTHQYYSPQASDYFALSIMARQLRSLIQTSLPRSTESIDAFRQYASRFTTMSDEQQARSLQDLIAQQLLGSSSAVTQPHASVPPSTVSQPNLLETHSAAQNLHADLLRDLYRKNGAVIGGIGVPYYDIAYTLNQQRRTPGINQSKLLRQQNAYLENYLAFIDTAAGCQAQGFRNDPQMNNYLRSMHQQFSLDEEELTPMQMLARSKKAIDELTRVTQALSANGSPNQALHKVINRLRRMSDDRSAIAKAELIEQEASSIPVAERVHVNRASANVQRLLNSLDSPRGIGCLCSSRQTTSARFFQNALDKQALENRGNQHNTAPRIR